RRLQHEPAQGLLRALRQGVRHHRPRPPERRLDELFPQGREQFDYSLPERGGKISWERLFRIADRCLHLYNDIGLNPGRTISIRHCTEWIVRRQEADGAWAGIQPPWIYSLLALKTEGYALTHPVIAKGLEALNAHWSYEKDGGVHIQACESPVWDTLLALMAMQDCEVDHDATPAMQRAVEWVLKQQADAPGDWQVKVPAVTPGGWSFERANTWYPDVDDTGVALIVLARLRAGGARGHRLDTAIERAREWVVAMQSRNGGWAAFDKDNDKAILTKIPFCDFGEALDPPSVDVTGHVLESFGLLGMGSSNPVVARALEYIRAEQEPDGSWFGRWGVNHIYGTAAVLPALQAVGEDMGAAYVGRAADWIAQHQNSDGGWGESPGSYMDPELRGTGESTASQTAWALMALLAVGREADRAHIERGVAYLLATQSKGTWEEPHYTGTGFPGYGLGQRIDLGRRDLDEKLQQGTELARGFMINYNLYRHYFPLMALGRARRFLRSELGAGHRE
ncbi:MAG: squalene--hopene cyclase, partial [Candidatus Neomarinimicrobiota bacterium]